MTSFLDLVDEDIDLHLNFSDVTPQQHSPATTVSAVVTPSSQTTTSTLAALLNNPCLPPTPPSSHCGSDSENVSFRSVFLFSTAFSLFFRRISEIRRKNAIKATPCVTSSTPSSTLISIQPKNAIHGSAGDVFGRQTKD